MNLNRRLTMSKQDSMNGRPVNAVAYWRMSTADQERSIPRQRAEMLPKCQLAGVHVVKEFQDAAKSGGGMKKRDDFLDMLKHCQDRARGPDAIEAIVVHDTSRFSRADSTETGHYIHLFREAGVHRVFTWERWFDFRKEEDRAIFLLQQDFTNNRFLRDHSLKVLEGMMKTAVAGFFVGGPVPYAFDRLLLNEKGEVMERVPRRAKPKLRKEKTWHEVLVPFPADDPDPDRQLERQTAVWLFETFVHGHVSLRRLAHDLNARGVPGPGSGYTGQRQRPGTHRWTGNAVRDLLGNPVYKGVYRVGLHSRGVHHRLVNGVITAVAKDAPPTVNTAGVLLAPLEAGGMVPATLWDAAQAKLAERRRGRTFARTGKYLMPSGVLHCGHCGGRMYGSTQSIRRKGKNYSYVKYVCDNAVRKGRCRRHAVHEGVVLDALAGQLLDVYTEPARLEALRQKLTGRAEARHGRVPAEVERLRRRLEALDVEVRDATRNVLRARDNVDLLNEALTELRKERDRVARDLEKAEQAEARPVEESTGQVEAAIARLFELRSQLEQARAEGQSRKLATVIRLLVTRVDVFFEPVEGTKKPRFRFVRGVIKTRPVLEVAPNESQGSPGSTRNTEAKRGHRPTLGPTDLEYELNHGLLSEPSKMPWETFRDLYEEEKLAGTREATRKKAGYVFDAFERTGQPPGRWASSPSARLAATPPSCGREDTRPPSFRGTLPIRGRRFAGPRTRSSSRQPPRWSCPRCRRRQPSARSWRGIRAALGQRPRWVLGRVPANRLVHRHAPQRDA
jgi:DNA invertase Pin-like site-specific DNA recombinase